MLKVCMNVTLTRSHSIYCTAHYTQKRQIHLILHFKVLVDVMNLPFYCFILYNALLKYI